MSIDNCEGCAMRLFNTKHYNLKGVGNPYFGKCIVVPNVDYNAYKKGDMGFSSQVDIIKEVIHSATGELHDVYIVPLIRCNETIACELNDDIYRRCIRYFADDIRKYDFRKIMLLGTAARRFVHCDIKDYLGQPILSANNRVYSVNYSPLVKYTNEELFDKFKSYLLKWYYD